MSILKTVLKKRASIENPATPLTAAFDILGGNNQTNTGESVTVEKALGLPGFWKGVNLICRTVAKTPLTVYRRKSEGKEEDKRHPAFRLLRKLPTGKSEIPMSAFSWKSSVMSNALTTGNGFSYIQRDQWSEPVALIWLDPNGTVPVVESGKLVYLYRTVDGELRRLNPYNVLHIKGLSFDGITGYSIVEIIKENLGLSLAYQKNQSIFFKNAMRPGWVVEVPWKFKDHNAVSEFRKRLGRVHQGLDNAHIPMILENNSKAKSMGMTHDDAQFMQSREFDLRMIANILLLPASKLNDVSKSAYNSLEQENQSTLDEAYDPWFVTWEQECEMKLLSEDEKEEDSHVISFKRNSLIQVNFRDKIEGYNKGLLSGWLSRDEIRSKEDMNPIKEDIGKEFYQPQNVKIAGSKNNDEDDDKSEIVEKSKDQRHEVSLDIAKESLKVSIERSLRRISHQAIRRSKDSNKFMEWVLSEVYEDNREVIRDMIEPMIRLCKLLGDGSTESEVTEKVDSWLLNLRQELNELTGRVKSSELYFEVSSFMELKEKSVDSFVNEILEN